MQSNTARAALGGALLVVAVVLFFLFQSGDSDSGENASRSKKPSQPRQEKAAAIPTISIKGGKPLGGVKELTYSEGDRVRFKVDSDVSDEVHVHAYDLMKDVKAGGSVTFDFPATIAGIFEAELEGRGEQIAELRVNP